MAVREFIENLFRVTEGEQILDIGDLAFGLALVLIAVGVGSFGWQYGVIIAGLIILLAVKPLSTWIK